MDERALEGTVDESNPTGSFSLQKTLDFLNSIWADDPAAVHALICNHVPCNDKLAEHAHAVCTTTRSPYQKNMLGPLGVINGIMSANNLPLIAVQFSEPDDMGDSSVVGFCAYPYHKPAVVPLKGQ